MVVRVPNDIRADITLRGVNMQGVSEPVLQLGDRSDLTLRPEGSNLLSKDGIRVPATARLTLVGDGDLTIVNNRNYSIGIGANCNDPYGTIVIDLGGTLTIRSSGDKVVCLGGGHSAGEGIRILRGTCDFHAAAITALGVGSMTGDASVTILDASVTAALDGNDAVGLGTFSGHAAVHSAGRLDILLNCERATGIGTMNGTGEIRLEGGSASVTLHCDVGACIGTFSGECSTDLRNAVLRIHGEGNRVAGFGSTDGACQTEIRSGDVQGELLAGERMLLGNNHSRVIITGGNVRLTPEGAQVPLSPGGLPLSCRTPEGDHFEQAFTDRRESWTYTADRNADGLLSVWIPASS